MKSIADLLGNQQQVFEFYDDYLKYFYEPPTKEHILLINCLRVIENNNIVFNTMDGKRGRPQKSRLKIFRCFVAKSILRISTVNKLLDRLKADRNFKKICGYGIDDTIPDESTFSRAFSSFSDIDLCGIFHEEMIEMHVKPTLVGHLSRDSTAISSRETPINKKKDVVKSSRRKRGRPKKGEIIIEKEQNNLEKQINQTAKESLSELNHNAAWGVKKNSQGKVNAWKGYKLHLDVNDVGLPITFILTGANVHDSQLAIPMEKLTSEKCTFLYSLMDAAYDANSIHSFIGSQGRVPIIDGNKRRSEQKEFDPAKKNRFKIRTTVERCNSHLKDWLFGQDIFVKGNKKVFQMLSFGILCLTAMKILQYYL